MDKFLILIFILTFLCSTTGFAVDSLSSASGDRAALLSFKSAISGNITGWDSPDMCNWTGVTCDQHSRRVTCLLLNDSGLSGVISPALGNLSVLTRLDLSRNHLFGSIPPELGALSQLVWLTLYDNFLGETIPSALGLLQGLTHLGLGNNNLSGNIPEAIFCNCSSLQHIALYNNSLTGEILFPMHCRLTELEQLILYSNKLVGRIPHSLANFTKLKWVLLQSNFLSGELPSQMFDKMPCLQYLYLSYNTLSSDENNTNLEPFFASLTNSTYLQELGIAGNRLGGKMPLLISNLSTKLNQLYLENNNISGTIPPGISNLNITHLNLSNNLLNGSIPAGISRPHWLQQLDLSNNFLFGEMPMSLGEGQSLGLIDISENWLNGSIPNTLSNLSQLETLILHHNHLSGAIPYSFGDRLKLSILDLSYNRLTGQVPTKMARLDSFSIYLNLSNNLLEGPFQLEIGEMGMTKALDLSSNKLLGLIPQQLGSLVALEYVNLSGNELEGTLPESIGALPNLHVLDVSQNNLTGVLPWTLQTSSLQHVNFSYNKFLGVVSSEGAFANLTIDSFLGNPGLCGSIHGMVRCKMKHALVLRIIMLIILVPVAITLLVMVCVVKFPIKLWSKNISSSVQSSSCPMRLVSTGEKQRKRPRISHRELIDATEGFAEANLLGAGGFGHVYSGILYDGTMIAVKVIDTNIGMEISSSFERECQVLKRIRHRNLIRVITTCSTPNFKALVLPLMLNGSLESLIHPPNGKPSHKLELEQLLSIVSDVAEGMAYLHHYAPFKVVHCDLKPSNVLLDEDMTAVVSDFGTSRLIKGAEDLEISDLAPCNSINGLLQGSVGYIAPEYGLGGHPSTQGDVYSFGVILLELISAKRPTDVIFQEGCNLHKWVKNHYPHDVDAIIVCPLLQDSLLSTSCLSTYERLKMDLIVELIELGLVCSQLSPSLRPTMVDVAYNIALMKEDFLKKHRVAFSDRSCSTLDYSSF